MKIEIKQLASNPQLSDETLCFTCSVYVDGKRAFTAMNRGTGGCHEYRTLEGKGREMLDKAEAYAKSLPPVDFGGMPRDSDLDLVIDQLVDRELARKELAKLFKTCLVWVDPVSGLMRLPRLLGDPEETRIKEAFAKRHTPPLAYLNDLPIEEAIDKYLEAVK